MNDFDYEMAWQNRRTGETDYHPKGWALTATREELQDFVPPSPPAQALYALYIDHTGKTPLEALTLVLKAATGTPQVE